MERRGLKIPQNKQIFFSSSADKISSLLEENKKIFGQYSFTILNQPFKEVRENSRKEVVGRALGSAKNLLLILQKKSTLLTSILSRAGTNRYFFIPGYGLKTSF